MKHSLSKLLFLLYIPTLQLLQVESTPVNGTCNSFESETINEGNKPCVYNNHIGAPIIGIGFNLEHKDAKQQLSTVGADYELVRAGTACLNDSQIRQLFENKMSKEVRCASMWLSSVWSKMNEKRQSAIADMAFSMGCQRLKTFKKMKAALERGNYVRAVYEMKDSRWCRQVKSRCDRATKCMQQDQ